MASPYAAIKFAAPNLLQRSLKSFLNTGSSRTVKNALMSAMKGKLPMGEFGIFSLTTARDLIIAQPTKRSFATHVAFWTAEAFTMKTLARGFKVNKHEDFSGQRSSLGYGSGYISWSKNQGMPADHLSTNGLSLALSNTRHTSVI